MKTWASAAVCLVCLASLAPTGCNRPRQRVTRLEDEMRQLESTLWDKEYELEKSQREVDSLQAKLSKADSVKASSTPDPAYDAAPPVITLPGGALPSGEIPERFRAPGSPDSDAPLFRLPEISPPGDDGFDVPSPSTRPPSGSNSPPAPLPPLSARVSDDIRPVGPTSRLLPGEAARVVAVTLDPQSTAGYDDDGASGDEGLTVVVQPRDADGRIVPTPGPISVVLVDPALASQGDVARVARWDFTTEQVARMWGGGSLFLKMAWPESRPSNGRLHLFARYTTGDGRRLETDREITIRRPGEPSSEWSATTIAEPREPVEGSIDSADSAWRPNPAAIAVSAALPSPRVRCEAPPVESDDESPSHVATRPVWSPTR